MAYATLPSVGPGVTSPIIKRLLIWTTVIALLSEAIQTLFNQFGLPYGPQDLLALSWWGISNGYVWQPITYLFTQSPIHNGITFSSLVSLFFNMYLLWVLGAHLVEVRGKGPFLRLYFISGALAGLISVLLMPVTGQYAVLAGATPSILALLTVWSMAFSETEILLFFLIPIKAKWMIASILGVVILMALSQWDISHFILDISAIFIGYLYAAIGWGWPSPFEFTHSMDSACASLGLRISRYLPKWAKPKSTRTGNPKIIDINTQTPLNNDEAFVDAMLAKISQKGEHALSWSERRRLNQIAERKMKNKR